MSVAGVLATSALMGCTVLTPENNQLRMQSKLLLLLSCLALSFVGLVAWQSSLTPEIDQDFFFAESDPALRADHAIAKRFGRQEQVLALVQGDITSSAYQTHVRVLSEALAGISGIHNVLSLSHGPGSLEEALESPLWRRLLLAKDANASNILLLFRGENNAETVEQIEEVVAEYRDPSFPLVLSGVPYVIEASRRELQSDVFTFSIATVLVFALVLGVRFRSWLLVFGSLLCCFTTCAATLLGMQLLAVPIGVLTANFVSICFVVSVAHLVFLEHNFRQSRESDQTPNTLRSAVRKTFPASLWAASTTAAGFATFLFVEARPLREFATTGMLAAVCALGSCYLLFPWFLTVNCSGQHKRRRTSATASSGFQAQCSVSFGEKAVVVCCFVFVIAFLPGLARIKTDASLLSYFDTRSEIYAGLADADRAGGTSPLRLVVASAGEETLASRSGYAHLWEVQEAIEIHPAVGSLISLPVVMAQADEHPLSFLLSWERIIGLLERERYQNIAAQFITQDRRQGLFIARMKEDYSPQSRVEVIEDIRLIVQRGGLHLLEVGGAYRLQAQMAELLRRSLQIGLVQLIPLFFVMGWIAGYRLRIGLAVALAVSVVPIVLLGALAYAGRSLDLATVPAAAIAVALGVDQLFHLIAAVRRKRVEGALSEFSSWQAARAELRVPVLYSLFIVACGAGVSALSSFPPVRIFGGLVVGGTFLAALTTLYVAPAIARGFSDTSLD